VALAIEEVVEESRDYAPRGHTDQLRSGIDSGGVITVGSEVRGFVISSAISSGGFEYAKKIHDGEDLHHASSKGGKANKSFIDFAVSGTTAEDKYQSGYINYPGTPPQYATKYLVRGFLGARDRVRKLLGG